MLVNATEWPAIVAGRMSYGTMAGNVLMESPTVNDGRELRIRE